MHNVRINQHELFFTIHKLFWFYASHSRKFRSPQIRENVLKRQTKTTTQDWWWVWCAIENPTMNLPQLQLTTLVIITKGHSTIFTLTRRQISIIFVANDHRPQQKNFRFGRASHVCTAFVEIKLHRSSTLKKHNNHWISKRLSGIRKSSRLVCKSNSCV